MILPVILYYYTKSISTILIYTILSLLLSVWIKLSIKKYYKKQTRENKEGKQVDLNSLYPSMCRTDSEPSFARLFLGVMSFMFIKMIVFGLTFVSFYILNKLGDALGLTGTDPKSFYKLRNFYCYLNNICLKAAGVFTFEEIKNKSKVEPIYKKYLGDKFNYEKEINSDDFACVTPNHIGWIDIFFMGANFSTSFVAKDSVLKIPIVGFICSQMQTVWIDRTSKESKEKAIKDIDTIQDNIMNKTRLNKLLLFVEGTGTNNQGLIDFKKGAFGKLYPVKPILNLIHNGGFGLGTGGMSTTMHMLSAFCYLYHDGWKMHNLPVITPTEYMFETYKDLGKDRIDVYTKVVQRIMSECGDIPILDGSFEQKLNYISDVKGKRIKST